MKEEKDMKFRIKNERHHVTAILLLKKAKEENTIRYSMVSEFHSMQESVSCL